MSRHGALERRAESKPARQHAAVLRPGEHPRNRSQLLDARSRATRGRPRAHGHAFDDVDRRREPEVLDEPGVVVDEAAVRGVARGGDFAHPRLPLLGLGVRLVREGRGDCHGSDRLLERADSDGPQAVVGADHFALLRHPQAAAHRAGGRAEHDARELSASAADGAAPAVEDREVDAKRLEGGHERRLGALYGPARRHNPAVLVAV